MRIIIVIISFLLSKEIFSQNNHPAYENNYIGWIKMINPNEAEKPFKQDHRTYSAKQMAISRMIVGWIQQSYTPKGAIGQAYKLVNEKLGLYNEKTKSLPQMYGGTTKTFIDLKKNAQNNWIPETNTNWYMEIAVNGPIGDFSDAITTADNYFFYIPGEKGLSATEKAVADLRGFSLNTTFKKYISWYQPKGIRTTLQYVVLLCKDNIKPYVQVTKGEYLEKLENAIERDAAEQLKKGNNAGTVNDLLAKRKAAVVRLKEKYKNRLNEPAKLQQQPDIHLENESNAEIFENRNYPSEYPVYKFDPAKLALTKTDVPQWIVISWEAEGIANGNLPGIHLHESMLNNVDYDYIYNYFFYPDKVKGIAYKPLRSPITKEKNTEVEKSVEAKKMESDNSVIYFEDFSSTSAGQKPNGWKSEINAAANPATVVNVKDRKEKWLEIKGQSFVYPQNIKLPLPQNFELSFDLAVPKDIAWGAKALEFYMGTKNKYDENTASIKLRLRAGFYGRAGEGTIASNFNGGNLVANKTFDITGFSNDKEFNTVKITLKKNGDLLEFFVDNNKVFDILKAYPATTAFNWLQFKHSNSDAENQKYYISNFKILKK